MCVPVLVGAAFVLWHFALISIMLGKSFGGNLPAAFSIDVRTYNVRLALDAFGV